MNRVGRNVDWVREGRLRDLPDAFPVWLSFFDDWFLKIAHSNTIPCLTCPTPLPQCNPFIRSLVAIFSSLFPVRRPTPILFRASQPGLAMTPTHLLSFFSHQKFTPTFRLVFFSHPRFFFLPILSDRVRTPVEMSLLSVPLVARLRGFLITKASLRLDNVVRSPLADRHRPFHGLFVLFFFWPGDPPILRNFFSRTPDIVPTPKMVDLFFCTCSNRSPSPSFVFPYPRLVAIFKNRRCIGDLFCL